VSSAILGDRSGEPILVCELMGALLAHAEELSDLDQADSRAHASRRIARPGLRLRESALEDDD